MEFEFRFVNDELEVLRRIVPGPDYTIVAHELVGPRELRFLSLSDAIHLGLTSHIYAKKDILLVRAISIEKEHRSGQYLHVVNDLIKPDHINIFAHTGSSTVLPRIALSLSPRFSIDETHVTAPPTLEFRRLFGVLKRRLKSTGKAVTHGRFAILFSLSAIKAIRSGKHSSGDRDLDEAISRLSAMKSRDTQ